MKVSFAIAWMLVAARVAAQADFEPTRGGLRQVSVACCCRDASWAMAF